MTASPVQLATGVILLEWLITTTANVLLETFVRVSLSLLCVGQAVAVKTLELGVGAIVVYVLVVTIALMIPSMSREYLVMPSIIVLKAHLRKDFAQVELIVLPQLQRPYHVQVCFLSRHFKCR